MTGKERVLIDNYCDGKPVLAIWSEPKTVTKRKNGSEFIRLGDQRHAVTRKPDGTLYLRLDAYSLKVSTLDDIVRKIGGS